MLTFKKLAPFDRYISEYFYMLIQEPFVYTILNTKTYYNRLKYIMKILMLSKNITRPSLQADKLKSKRLFHFAENH